MSLEDFPWPIRISREPQPGLMNARRHGFQATQSPIMLFLDDDNFVAPDYVAQVLQFFATHESAGAVGGRIFPLLEMPAPAWFAPELLRHLAIRDLGPDCYKLTGIETPFGAGMAARRAAMEPALDANFVFMGRTGASLSSGEDSELCYRMKNAGWELWHDGRLSLQHFLFHNRFTAEYMERFHFAMGYDRPVLEMFWASGTPWRRLTYLRNSLRAALRSLPSWGDVISHDPAPIIHRRLERARQRGLAISFWNLAWGPPIWKKVQTLKKD
ncbi:glycosyltransferase [Oscillatoria amoena NRMC-F 0135]|nr:glycosyltransferase [Oscillatoria amoena NRMC-F 0135]